MKRILHVLMLLVFVGAGLFFGSLNRAPAQVDFFFFAVEWPLALALAAFFFGGALFGGLLTWFGGWLTARRRIRELRRELQTQARTDSTALVPSGPGRDGPDAAGTSG